MMKPERRKLFTFLLICGAASAAAALIIRSSARIIGEHSPRIFGATYMTMNNPYFTALNESIREVVEAHGDILLTRDPAQNQERQNEQISEMIDEGMTVLFANPADWAAIDPALEECRKAGVAVFAVDTTLYNTDNVISVIQSDQYEAGRLVAEDMMKRKPDGARIITLDHYNVHSTVIRLQAFLDQIEGLGRYQVIDSSDDASEIEVGNRDMKRMLVLNTDMDVVFGANDPAAIGALSAIQSDRERTGYRRSVLVYGVDGSPDAKALIRKGEMTGSAVQYPIRMGRMAADLAYRYLAGEPVPKNCDVEVTMLTAETLDPDNLNSWQ